MKNLLTRFWSDTTTTHGGRMCFAMVLLGMAVVGFEDEATSQGGSAAKDAPAVTYPRTTIDFGLVVSDLEKSAAFYKDALGLTEVDPFSVGADFCTAAGLTDGQPLSIRVFVLGEGETATRVKLMEVPAANPKKIDNAFIHSSLGMRYLTLVTSDLAKSLERAARHGAKPVAEGPVRLPKGFPQELGLACVKDPDGNLIELIGPMPE